MKRRRLLNQEAKHTLLQSTSIVRRNQDVRLKLEAIDIIEIKFSCLSNEVELNDDWDEMQVREDKKGRKSANVLISLSAVSSHQGPIPSWKSWKRAALACQFRITSATSDADAESESELLSRGCGWRWRGNPFEAVCAARTRGTRTAR